MAKSDRRAVILPKETEENIMSRLPVKTILRFMSACKSWYSLFHNPYFINIHNPNPNYSENFLLMRLHKSNDIVVMDSGFSAVLSRFFIPESHQVDDYEIEIVGSCNGIVCVHGISILCDVSWTTHEYIYLWNPALKVTKSIMNRCGYLNMRDTEKVYVGFGLFHDNDYKVIRFQTSFATQVEIYSLSCDSWRTVNAAPPAYSIRESSSSFIHFMQASGVHVNGAHYWDYEIDSCSGIFSFDMGEEVFKDVIIPSECIKCSLILFNCNESLAMLTLNGGMNPCPCIWLMKDYGWCKLCKFDIPHQRELISFHGFIQPKNEVILSWFLSDQSEQGFSTQYGSFSLDMVKTDTNNSITDFMDALKDHVLQVMTYRESILLLDSTNLIHHP